MAYSSRFWIVIPASDRDALNGIAFQMFDPDGGSNTFNVGLSSTGAVPATHYWCCTAVRSERWEQLAALAMQYPNINAYVVAEDAQSCAAAFSGIQNVQIGVWAADTVLSHESLQVVD